MTANITDVDTFTDPIVAPADGDAGNGVTFQYAPQGLSNRTRNLKNRLDAAVAFVYGYYSFPTSTPGLISPSTKIPPTQVAASGCTIASDQINVPSAGLYMVDAQVSGSLIDLSAAAGDPAEVELRINNTLVQIAQGFSYDGTAARLANLKLGGVFSLALNDKVDVRSRTHGIALAAGYLSVVRIK